MSNNNSGYDFIQENFHDSYYTPKLFFYFDPSINKDFLGKIFGILKKENFCTDLCSFQRRTVYVLLTSEYKETLGFFEYFKDSYHNDPGGILKENKNQSIKIFIREILSSF